MISSRRAFACASEAPNSRRSLGVLPSPLWGGAGGGGCCLRRRSCFTAPPPPRPPLLRFGGRPSPQGGGERPSLSRALQGDDRRRVVRSWRSASTCLFALLPCFAPRRPM